MKTCSECGARVPDEVDVCDLCGSPVASVSDVPDTDIGDSTGGAVPSTKPDGIDKSSSVFCNQCGHKNPPSSSFCSSCGSTLETSTASASASIAGEAVATTARESTSQDPESDSKGESSAGRQISIVVGAGALIVLALYLISSLSSSPDRPTSTTAVPVASPISGPLTGPYVTEAERLIDEIKDLSEDERIEKQWELIDIYRSATRLDLAAVEAEKIAMTVQTERSWIDAGNLYFDWMDRLDTPFKGPYAAKAIEAYQKALDINPDNLDVRTDMGIALMYDPTRAMLAIQETSKVLAKDSLHVQANFNRGVMLRQISRLDQAVAQFEKVKRIIGDPENPVYQRAEAAISSIRGDS